MPLNSSAIGSFSSSPCIEASSSSSSMNPQQKALDQCIVRLWKVIIQTQTTVYNATTHSDRMEKLKCPITLGFCEDPVVTKCGHLFGRKGLENYWEVSKTENCPTCRAACDKKTTAVYALRGFDQVPEDFIPTCSKFKPANSEKVQSRAQLLISTAKELIEEEEFSEAINLLSTAFKYTNSSEDYSLVPKLYDAWGDSDKAALSRLYLSLYQLQEGRIEETAKTLGELKTLSCCDENIVNPALLSALQFHAQHESTQDRTQLSKDLLGDITIKETEDKIFLCEQILILDPYQFDAHEKLIALTPDASEKRRLCRQAAELAKQIGNTALEEIFLKGPKVPPPPSITKKQWRNADKMELPPYPPELEKFLEEQDPYDPTKTKRETHIVVPLFPDIKDENGSTTPFTLKSLEELDKNPDGTGGFSFVGGVESFLDKIPAKDLVAGREFRYGVMTKDVIPKSTNKTYAEQERMILPGYKIPKIFDAARAVFWENRRTRTRYTRYFTQNPPALARFSDELTKDRRLMGGFHTPSFYLQAYFLGPSQNVGVALWREF